MNKKKLLENPLVKEIALEWFKYSQEDATAEKRWAQYLNSQIEKTLPEGIVAFRSNKNRTIIIKADSQLKNCYCEKDGCAPLWQLKELVDSKMWEIYTVKNSKGEEFSIGDNVQWIRYDEKDIVREFEILSDQIYINKKWLLDNCKKIVKQPLFKTDDGFDVFEGDEFIRVIPSTLDLCEFNTNEFGEDLPNLIKRKGYKTFKDSNNAEAWISMNIPQFSEQQILDALLEAAKKVSVPNSFALHFKQKLGIK